jgi:endonuclease-3
MRAKAPPSPRSRIKSGSHDGQRTKPARKRTAAERERIETIFERFAEADPAPATELNATSRYTLLVAVVLSAQATDKSVNRATEGLFEAANTPDKMLALGEAAVANHIKTIGLFRTKAKNVIALSQILLRQYGGEVPTERNALEALPGVGRKTANVVLNVVFGESTMAVDTHIFRLGNRTGLAPGKTVREVEDALLARVPANMLRDAHHWLILHGRYVCKARKPECWRCPVVDLCPYKPKTAAPGTAPPAAPGATRRKRHVQSEP